MSDTASISARAYLTDAQIGELLDVPTATVGWWRRTGGLPFIKAGRHPRVRRVDLDAFLEARTVPQPTREGHR